MEKFLINHKIWLEVLTFITVLIIGCFQISINNRLKNLQDYIAIAVVPDSRTGKLNLLNTGKINVYLWGFDMPDRKIKFQKPRLITAETGDASYYWIDPPVNLQDKQEFEFTLYLEDEFNRKWISEHGGRADKIQIEKDGKKIDALEIKVWSYKTYEKKWFIQ